MALDLRFRPLDRPLAPPDFRYAKGSLSAGWERQIRELERELTILRADDIVIEAGVETHQVRADGWLKGGAAPRFPDVRLSFSSAKGPLRLACFLYADWRANLRAIGLTLQDLRLMNERGTSPNGEAYRGWTALPPGASSIAAAEWGSKRDAAGYLWSAARWNVSAEEHPGLLIDDPDLLAACFRDAAKAGHGDMAKAKRARDFIAGGAA